MVFGKRVQSRAASLWRVELREVVSRILGTGGGSSEKSVGNFRASEEGVRSRFVLVVDGAFEDARCRTFFGSSSSPSSDPESESNMLSTSSSLPSSSSCNTSCSAASASSIRRLFNCSTSTLIPKSSPSTSSHTRFLSIVIGTFLANLSLLSSGSRSSSRFRVKRSSLRWLSLAFFCLT